MRQSLNAAAAPFYGSAHFAEAPLWVSVVNDPNSPATVSALYETIRSVSNGLKQPDGAAKLNEALKLIRADSGSLRHCAAVLRSLSAHKSSLER